MYSILHLDLDALFRMRVSRDIYTTYFMDVVFLPILSHVFNICLP
jgi:hypothetical protein